MSLLLALGASILCLPGAPAARGGPDELRALLARYDALPAGAQRDALEEAIDACAAQVHAVHARLYWNTDLDAARAAARAEGKPILSLRLLGRLDQELSCANSRLFRVALYADRELAAFLREHFVLHWSSERPVPRVTIDFGDGRAIRTTLAGNSVHYVLDQDGRPIDALPGLYSPVAFRRELEALLPLARQSPALADAERAAAIARLHGEHDLALAATWGEPEPPLLDLSALAPSAFGRAGRPAPTFALPAVGIAPAEARAPTKMDLELTLVRAVGLVPSPRPSPRRLDEARLDASSRALLAELAPGDWDAAEFRPLAGPALDELVARLEASIAGDTEHNERWLRPAIHACVRELGGAPRLEDLNREVYARVFLTPREDAWLGLALPGTFTGLPRDGRVE